MKNPTTSSKSKKIKTPVEEYDEKSYRESDRPKIIKTNGKSKLLKWILIVASIIVLIAIIAVVLYKVLKKPKPTPNPEEEIDTTHDEPIPIPNPNQGQSIQKEFEILTKVGELKEISVVQ